MPSKPECDGVPVGRGSQASLSIRGINRGRLLQLSRRLGAVKAERTQRDRPLILACRFVRPPKSRQRPPLPIGDSLPAPTTDRIPGSNGPRRITFAEQRVPSPERRF